MNITSATSRMVDAVQSTGTRELVQASSTVPAGGGTAAQAPSSEHVAQAVKQVNDAFIQKGQNLFAAIEKDKITGINVVKVMDKNTQEVVTQFPSKGVIAMAEAINQSMEAKGQMLHVSA